MTCIHACKYMSSLPMIHSFDSATYIHTLYIYIYINIINPGAVLRIPVPILFAFPVTTSAGTIAIGDKPDLLMSPSWTTTAAGVLVGCLGSGEHFPSNSKRCLQCCTSCCQKFFLAPLSVLTTSRWSGPFPVRSYPVLEVGIL